MKMTKLAGDCNNAWDCPGVFLIERGTVAVQAIVEIPLALLLEAANAAR